MVCKRQHSPVFPCLIAILALVLAVAGGPAAMADSYVLYSSVLASSGGRLCGSPEHDLVFTLGEPGIGRSESARYTMWSGFKPRICIAALCPMPGALEVAQPRGSGLTRIANLTPNPTTNGIRILYETPTETQADISVIDTRGRIVKHLPTHTAGPGPRAIAWDGCDDRGHLVASGVYFVRLQGGPSTAVAKLVVLR